MSLSNVYTTGLNNVGSYQVSGMPYAIDPSSTEINFPFVTRWVRITNTGSAEVKVGFSANGVAGTSNFIVPPNSSTEPLELKLTELHLSDHDGISIVAGLTGIPVARIDNLSGSGAGVLGTNWSGSVGVD